MRFFQYGTVLYQYKYILFKLSVEILSENEKSLLKSRNNCLVNNFMTMILLSFDGSNTSVCLSTVCSPCIVGFYIDHVCEVFSTPSRR